MFCISSNNVYIMLILSSKDVRLSYVLVTTCNNLILEIVDVYISLMYIHDVAEVKECTFAMLPT